MMLPDWFTLEESRALLYYIYPHWPDPRGWQRPPDDLKAWLRDLRAKKER